MADFNPLKDLHQSLMQEKACEAHGELKRSESIEEADLWWDTVNRCSSHNRLAHLRWLGRNDLYFLLVHMLNAKYLAGWDVTDASQPRSEKAAQWFFERCKEVQESPDNHIDLWSRGGGKSMIITHGKTIQDILTNPNLTFGIFSHTRPNAKQFLVLIKREFESNQLLKEVYPDILYQDPRTESPKWSEDDGIVVKRTTNSKESTVEAWGLVDGQPTGKHYSILVMDDVIDDKYVTSGGMIDKVTRAWEISLNLGSGQGALKFRVAGTFYEVGDTYHVMIERGFGTLRARPIIIGTKSLLLSDERLALLKQSMSPRQWALQILLDPRMSDKERGFKQEWLRHWKVKPSIKSLNRYIFVDPGGKGEESTSLTAMVVVGLGADRKFYILDLLADRLNLQQKGDHLFRLHREYSPLKTYYERYSMQADIEHMKYRMGNETYHFQIEEVGALGTQLPKDRRIEKIQPDFSNGLFLLPPLHTIKHTMYDGKEVDMVEYFINKEYLPFPFTRMKDILDALARVRDPMVVLTFPRSYGRKERNEHWQGGNNFDGGSWMAG